MRLKTAVFLTFRFDSGFFEQEVLPVFLDVSLSHATQLRLVQLEDALPPTGARIAVYYDANGSLARRRWLGQARYSSHPGPPPPPASSTRRTSFF